MHRRRTRLGSVYHQREPGMINNLKSAYIELATAACALMLLLASLT